MRIDLRFHGGKRADFGSHDYEAILASALARFAHRLKLVCVYVEDVNGPRGGVDKRCRCVLHRRRLPPLVIQDQGDRVGSLIYRVAQRAAHAVSKEVERVTHRKGRPSTARLASANLGLADPLGGDLAEMR